MGKQVDWVFLFVSLKMFYFFQVVRNVCFMENYLMHVDLKAKG